MCLCVCVCVDNIRKRKREKEKNPKGLHVLQNRAKPRTRKKEGLKLLVLLVAKNEGWAVSFSSSSLFWAYCHIGNTMSAVGPSSNTSHWPVGGWTSSTDSSTWYVFPTFAFRIRPIVDQSTTSVIGSSSSIACFSFVSWRTSTEPMCCGFLSRSTRKLLILYWKVYFFLSFFVISAKEDYWNSFSYYSSLVVLLFVWLKRVERRWRAVASEQRPCAAVRLAGFSGKKGLTRHPDAHAHARCCALSLSFFFFSLFLSFPSLSFSFINGQHARTHTTRTTVSFLCLCSS